MKKKENKMSKPIFKDGKRYYFNSKKFSSLNSMFGIDEEVKNEVNENLQKQTNYMKNNFVCLNDEKYISFYDMSKSANIKPEQYYGEMFNKVSTLRKFAEHIGFTAPVFMTITPPSYLKPLKQVNLKRNRVKLIDNPRFTGEAEYVNEARKYQSEKWTKFLNQRIFKDIKKKYNERLIYMRTYEPMIDGTPHVHIVAFIPPEFKERFVKLAKKYFRDTRFDIKTEFDDGIGGVVVYILKYILKSFSNSKTKELDDVGYWYAYHGIRRFTTSRTLIPMKIYRLINSKEDYKDLLKTTLLYKSNKIEIQVSINSLKYEYTDFHDIKSTDFKISEVSVFIEDFDETYFKILYEKSENISVYKVSTSKAKMPKYIKNLKPNKYNKIKIEMDNEYYIFTKGELIKINPVPAHMKSFELYQYYLKLGRNIDTADLVHYGVTQNECIKRGLIDDIPLQSLDDFNTDIGA